MYVFYIDSKKPTLNSKKNKKVVSLGVAVMRANIVRFFSVARQ